MSWMQRLFPSCLYHHNCGELFRKRPAGLFQNQEYDSTGMKLAVSPDCSADFSVSSLSINTRVQIPGIETVARNRSGLRRDDRRHRDRGLNVAVLCGRRPGQKLLPVKTACHGFLWITQRTDRHRRCHDPPCYAVHIPWFSIRNRL